MTLESPFFIYGYTYEDNSKSVGNTVTITDSASNTLTEDSGTDGYYSINVQSIAEDGETLHISSQNAIGGSGNSYTVSIDDLSHQQDIYLNAVVGDLIIYYSSLSIPYGVSCWCNRWDVSDFSVTLETYLDKSDLNTLRNHITPGAVGELYEILGSKTYYDTTWEGRNTLKFEPREIPNSNLSNMRNSIIGYVKNVTTSPMKNRDDWINVKLECKISGSKL